MRIKLTVSYDGALFYGFQHQTGKRSVEDTLLEAIKKIDSTVSKIYGSGRTDRYVHARGQVVHFDSDLNVIEGKWMIAINAYLPDDIRVIKSEYVDSTFHARYSAKSKEYRYLIRYKSYDIFQRNYMDYFTNLDLEKIKNNIKRFEGTHDFRGFCSAQLAPLKDTVKTITKTEMNIYDEYIELVFIGNGFLKYQVRKMVGTLIDIAIGKKKEEIIDTIFETCDPKLSNRVLSGHGLYLVRVDY